MADEKATKDVESRETSKRSWKVRFASVMRCGRLSTELIDASAVPTVLGDLLHGSHDLSDVELQSLGFTP